MKKKLVAVVLTFAMAVSMIACAASGSQSTGTAKENEKTNSQDDNEKEMVAPSGAYEDTVTISYVDVERNVIYPEGDDIEENAWTRKLLEDYNIDVVIDWTCPSSEYNTKLNLAIGSGNLPDVFRVNYEQLKMLIEANQIYDLSDVFEKYASDGVKDVRVENEDIFQSTVRGDALYAIPGLHYGYVTVPWVLWIRNDWKEKTGFAAPATIEDLEKMCLAFMEECGADYGMAVSNNLDELYNLAPAWNAYPQTWIRDKNGDVVYGGVQAEMKEALGVWHDWYEKKIISPNFISADSALITQDYMNGAVGMQVAANWAGWGAITEAVKANSVEAISYAYSIPSATGEEVKIPVDYPNSEYYVVNKDCEHPEAVIKMLNLYWKIIAEDAGSMSPEERLKYTDTGREHVYPIKLINTEGDLGAYFAISEAVRTGEPVAENSPYYLKYVTCMDWVENQNADNLGLYLQCGDPEGSAYAVNNKLLENDLLLKNVLWADSPKEWEEYSSVLKDMLTEGYIKIIIGEESLDYFDTLVENWKVAGGDVCTTAMNKLYTE